MWQLVTGAVQMCATDDLQRNLAVCKERVTEAASAGARLVLLPECFPFLGQKEGDKLAVAEVLDAAAPGPILGALFELAAKNNVWLVGGGMPERVAGDERRTYNTAVVVSPAGAIAATYRKIHLFDVDIPATAEPEPPDNDAAARPSGRGGVRGAVLRESDATRAGTERVVVDIDGAKVGLSICYDVRFPELYRSLVKDHGAEVIVVPAAFTAHTGRAHWHLLLRARAIEDQAWVVAPAQWGRHNEKRESFGHTLVIDPWGTIIGERADGDGVVIARLDGEAVAKTRRQMPCLDHAVLWK
jgi:predicted amidohydrolase